MTLNICKNCGKSEINLNQISDDLVSGRIELAYLFDSTINF